MYSLISNCIKFDLHQVIGVKNKDETFKKFRAFKQIEERLNRTYKQNYYGTNGYDKIEGANSYMILFVCFFNFLRLHSSLKYRISVSSLFDNNIFMPDQWLKLVEISHKYHPSINQSFLQSVIQETIPSLRLLGVFLTL